MPQHASHEDVPDNHAMYWALAFETAFSNFSDSLIESQYMAYWNPSYSSISLII